MTSTPPDLPRSAEQSLHRRMLDRIVDRLAYSYDDRFTYDLVAATFGDSYARLAESASITAFLPILAERLTRERLDALAQAEGKVTKPVPEVLFVCVRNAGRSQMAAALARHHAGTRLHIRTGGSDPGERIHPEVVHAMKEVGLGVAEEFPKPLTDEVLAAADVVITMGCGDTCPYVPGRRYEDWAIPDPDGATAEQVSAIRDDIDRRVRGLLSSLLPDLRLDS